MAQREFEPMSIGGILDGAFSLYRNRFVTFLATTAIVHVPVQVLVILLSGFIIPAVRETANRTPTGEIAPGAILGLGATGLAIALLGAVGQQLATGALVKGISDHYVGDEPTVGRSYSFVLPKLFRLVIAALLITLIVGVGLILCVVPGIIFGLWFSLTLPAIVVEDAKVLEAMSRSKDLVKGNLGKVFAVLLLVILITWFAGFIFGQVGNLVGLAIAETSPTLAVGVMQTFQALPQILLAPFAAGATVLLYYDMRIRKEGFDLEMMAQQMGGTRPEATEFDAGQPPA